MQNTNTINVKNVNYMTFDFGKYNIQLTFHIFCTFFSLQQTYFTDSTQSFNISHLVPLLTFSLAGTNYSLVFSFFEWCCQRLCIHP